MEAPLGSGVAGTVGGILAPDLGAKFAGISAGRVRDTSVLAEAVDQMGHLTQALEIKQMRRGRKGSRGVGGVICRAEGDSGMAAEGAPGSSNGVDPWIAREIAEHRLD